MNTPTHTRILAHIHQDRLRHTVRALTKTNETERKRESGRDRERVGEKEREWERERKSERECVSEKECEKVNGRVRGTEVGERERVCV